MIKIAIDKEISRWWGITESEISEQLKSAQQGEEIEITINSPGGEVYEGISIFNLIREYAKSHDITVKITGLAASMASYIAIAARTVNKESKIIVYENSIFLIHNPWNLTCGDYREFKKAADYLEKLAIMCGSTYAYISGKTEKETRALMDDETYFVGNEILDNGFANSFEKINDEESDKENQDFELDRNALIVNAKLKIDKAIESLRATAKNDLEKAVALLSIDKNPASNTAPPAAGHGLGAAPGISGEEPHFESTNSQEGAIMDKEELRKTYPKIYSAIFNEGMEAGLKKERGRVEAHLKLGEKSGSMKLAAQFIREGKSVREDTVHAEYLSARMNHTSLGARNDDNPPPLNTANGQGADEAAMQAAWNLGISGKAENGEKYE